MSVSLGDDQPRSLSEGNFLLHNSVYNTPKACPLFRIDLEGNKRLSPGYRATCLSVGAAN